MAAFKTLFKVNITHSYYSDANLKDVKIVPTVECSKIIKSRRLLFRSLGSSIQLLYREVGNAPLVSVNGLKFDFLLYPKDRGAFLNYSNLKTGGKQPASKNVLFFRNDPVNNKKLKYSLLEAIKPQIFDYTFPFKAQDPHNDEGDFDIEDLQGNNILTVEDLACNDQGIYQYRVDLSDYPSGRYFFKSSDENHNLVTEEILIDNDLFKQHPFGLIQIEVNPNTRESYDLKFKRSTSKWVYYIINRSGISLNDYDMKILDESGDDGSEIYDTYVFNGNQSPDPDDSINNFETLVFKSTKKIPFYQVPKSSLKLKKVDVQANPNTTEVLMKNLPNADPDGILNANNESEIMIYI